MSNYFCTIFFKKKKMSLLSKVLFFAIALIAVSCSSVKESATKISQPLKIDANLDDWDVPLTNFAQEGIRAGFKNDDENLYIALMFNDQQLIRQIKMSGLQIWFDDKCSKEKKTGIKYPIGMQGKMPDGGMPDRDRSMPPDQLPEIKFDINDRLEELRLISTNDINGSAINIRKTNQIEIALKYENYTLKYEIKIPYKKIDNLLGLNIDKAKGISIGFFTEKPEFKKEKRSDMVNGMHDNNNQDGTMGGPRGSMELFRGNIGGDGNTNLDFWLNLMFYQVNQ